MLICPLRHAAQVDLFRTRMAPGHLGPLTIKIVFSFKTLTVHFICLIDFFFFNMQR